MAGAVDLFSGSTSIHGSNLFDVDKSPLAQLSGGIEDVIGKQAGLGGSSVITGFEAILRSLLGFDPLEEFLVIGSDLLGTTLNIGTYFGNLETFLGELNPLDPHFDPIAAAVTFITTVLNPAGLGSLITGVAVSAIDGLAEFILSLIGSGAGLVAGGVQGLIDAIFGGLTSSTSTGNPLESIQPALQQVALDIQTVSNAAESALATVFQFGGVLHALVDGLEHNPVYESAEHFLEAIGGIVGTVWGNVVTSLSPNNPTVQQNSAAITAILAHLSASTVAGINYQFSPVVPLSNNYLTTANPAFTAPTGFALPVANSTDYVLTPSISMGVFTGNPNSAASDHGVVTDRAHVQVTVRDVAFGEGEVFMSGNGTTSLGAHVALRCYADFFGQTLSIVTYTSPLTGGQVRASVTTPISANNTIAIEFDGVKTYSMYVNGVEVGEPWHDDLGVMTHGAGFRESGIKVNMGNVFFAPGPAFGSFIAYDF